MRKLLFSKRNVTCVLRKSSPDTGPPGSFSSKSLNPYAGIAHAKTEYTAACY